MHKYKDWLKTIPIKKVSLYCFFFSLVLLSLLMYGEIAASSVFSIIIAIQKLLGKRLSDTWSYLDVQTQILITLICLVFAVYVLLTDRQKFTTAVNKFLDKYVNR